MALILGVAVMTPGAFYLAFLVLRIRDAGVAANEKLDADVIRRAAMLFALAVPCVASVILGIVVLSTTFGWLVPAGTGFLTALALLYARRAKTPTEEGAKLLGQIEGFREFLESVERLPMDRADAPGDHAGLYEKYLPYAVALEVDQKWSDKLIALASTIHQSEALTSAHSFYLGMWNGKPVEMVFKSEPPRGRAF